jgi:hypothetical protein
VGPPLHGGLRDGLTCWAVAKEPIIMIRLKQEIIFVFMISSLSQDFRFVTATNLLPASRVNVFLYGPGLSRLKVPGKDSAAQNN